LLQIGPLLIVSGRSIPLLAAVRDRGTGRTGLALPTGASWIVGVGAMVAWFLPSLFTWMMMSAVRHAFVAASLVIAGLIFWSPIFSRQRSHRLHTGQAIAYLFSACLVSTIAGAWVAFAPSDLYPGHVASVGDQQLAGLIMWVPCCLVYLAAILASIARWYGGEDRDEERGLAHAEA
jgi:cytochrome c oxidase assembly factor CtaG